MSDAMRFSPSELVVHMVHVAPGKTQALVWQFTNAGEFNCACLVPGHFEAGMVGRLRHARIGLRKSSPPSGWHVKYRL